MLGGAATIGNVGERAGATRLMRRGRGFARPRRFPPPPHGAGVLYSRFGKECGSPRSLGKKSTTAPRGGGCCHNLKRRLVGGGFDGDHLDDLTPNPSKGLTVTRRAKEGGE